MTRLWIYFIMVLNAYDIVRKDMDVNEYERLSNLHLRCKFKKNCSQRMVSSVCNI